MAQRAALPTPAVTITPGYSWRLDLDVKFDDVRPADWPDWTVRMLIWGEGIAGIKLTNGAGVSIEPVNDLPGETAPVTIPVIRLTGAQTQALRGGKGVNYIIDLKAPQGEAEDYFAGPMSFAFAPPAELLG